MKLQLNHPIAQAITAMISAETPLSHDDLSLAFERVRLGNFDPGRQDASGAPIGKQRRARAVLTHAADEAPLAGGELVLYLLQRLAGCGCFRAGSRGLIPAELVENAKAPLRAAGYELHADGVATPIVLESLSGERLSDALRAYVDRARHGAADAALVAGTGKDLLEATARHVLVESVGSYNPHMPFAGTLLAAYRALGIAIDDSKVMAALEGLSDSPVQRVNEALLLVGLAVNRLRNAEGIGHGRPQPVDLETHTAITSAEATGLVAGFLLDRLGGP